MRTPLAVIGVVLAGLIGLAALGVGSDDDGGGAQEAAAPPKPPHRVAPIATIARRVEALRELRFHRPPAIKRISARQTRRQGLRDFDRSYPAAQRRADQAVLALLGLLEPRDDLRDAAGSIFGSQVAGFYDTRTKRLRIVDGTTASGPVSDEITIAHELTHALEDRSFDFDEKELEGSGDAALAHSALIEGTATALMFEYADRHLDPGQTLEEMLGQSLGDDGTEGIPPYLMDQMVFPYVEGKAFVEQIYGLARGWRLVNLAEKVRPPASTEQVLHPEKWLRVEQPDRVRLRLGRVLGAGWERESADALGEWNTAEWLKPIGGESSATGAAGWGGDRYELWRERGSLRGCRAPCAPRRALVVRWRWDTRRDAREFAEAARRAIPSRGATRPAGDGLWSRRDAAIALHAEGGETTLAIAPDTGLARRLARSR